MDNIIIEILLLENKKQLINKIIINNKVVNEFDKAKGYIDFLVLDNYIGKDFIIRRIKDDKIISEEKCILTALNYNLTEASYSTIEYIKK